jgi:hypothetical protein
MVFVNQKYLEIELDVKNIDLTAAGATNTKIYFQRPDGTGGQWSASIRDKKFLFFKFTSTDYLNMEGKWLFQPYAEITSLPTYGDKVEWMVYKPLTGL